MAIPRKKSRTINIEGTKYRWLVSSSEGVITLTIEKDDDPGQLLQTFSEPHKLYKKNKEGTWTYQKQGRSITPELVKKVIAHGIANGWEPEKKGKPVLQISSWDSDKISPKLKEETGDTAYLKDIAIEQVSDLRFDLSTDPEWRKILFGSEVHKRVPIPEDYFALSERSKECNLHYAAFNDGWTGEGFVVFGIESVEFPYVVMYTTNNPAIVDW